VLYHPFFLPNNDFPSFQRTAESLARLELPQSFQRMPVLPALMALLAPALPGPHPYLHAALIVNAAFSLGLLVLLYVFASQCFGRGALLLPVLVASTTQFQSMALQPLVEPSLGFFVVLAFVLFQRRSPWQYAAAFAVGLSRYEAVMVIPVLFLVNVAWDRQLLRQLLLAAAASSGCLVWLALGLLSGSGSGGGTYLDLMSGMSFTAAPDFLARSVKEPFRGFYRDTLGPGLLVFCVAVLLPLVYGLRVGLREFRRESAAMLGFLLLSTLVIIVFGINKARYVYPTEWIWLLFFSAGAVRIAGIGFTRARALPAGARAGALALAGLLLALSAWRWGQRLTVSPSAVDTGFVVLCFGTLLAGAVLAARAPRTAWYPPALVLLAIALPLVAGGVVATQRELFKVRHANYGSVLAARWLEQNLAENERALVLARSHVLHLTPLGEDQVVGFLDLRAENLEQLRAEMRARGLRYAVYTWRKPIQTPSDAYYRQKLKSYLAEPFEAGDPVDGFEHVASIPLPEALERAPVQVYRLLEKDTG